MTMQRTTVISLACAPAASVAFVILYIMAVSEDPSYSVFDNYLSDLGVGPGAWAFNLGAAISGCLLAVFAIGGTRTYFSNNSAVRAGAVLMSVSGGFLVGVGIFTENAGDTHLFMSYAFFVCAFLSMAVLAAGSVQFLRTFADPFIILSFASFAVVVSIVAAFGADPFAETVAVFVLLAWGFLAPLAISYRFTKRRVL